ncbi:MAG: hypothetical protein L0H31_05095 [Nocardioidaceae bacterium]|nr:hypothetical protein [Nocardioidaceae bacterium]
MTEGFMGLVGLGSITPIPGTSPHPDSWEFATRANPVHHPDLIRLAISADDELYPSVLAASMELVEQGATSILTTCGYFTPYQDRLAVDLPVPVTTSSLMLLPWLERMTSGSILVVAADAKGVDTRCLSASGLRELDRVTVAGMSEPGPFRDQVLERGTLDDPGAIRRQAVETVRMALAARPGITSICLECGDMTIVSDVLREEFGLPVVDYMSAGQLLHGVTGTVRMAPVVV